MAACTKGEHRVPVVFGGSFPDPRHFETDPALIVGGMLMEGSGSIQIITDSGRPETYGFSTDQEHCLEVLNDFENIKKKLFLLM